MKKETITGGFETRIFNHLVELRADDENPRRVQGVAARTGVLSRTLYGWFKEKIDARAFDGADMSDVVALKNHNNDLILARSNANVQTLTLSIQDDGSLAYEFDAPDTTTGNDLLQEVKSRLIQHSSFSFAVKEDRWEEDEEGNEIRVIMKFSKIYDVSPVVNPAYLQTQVDARSLELVQRSYDEFKKVQESFARRNLTERELLIKRHRYNF